MGFGLQKKKKIDKNYYLFPDIYVRSSEFPVSTGLHHYHDSPGTYFIYMTANSISRLLQHMLQELLLGLQYLKVLRELMKVLREYDEDTISTNMLWVKERVYLI